MPSISRLYLLLSTKNFRYLKYSLPYVSCVDTAYVRESPPKQPHQVQETCHFRYLRKFFVRTFGDFFGTIFSPKVPRGQLLLPRFSSKEKLRSGLLLVGGTWRANTRPPSPFLGERRNWHLQVPEKKGGTKDLKVMKNFPRIHAGCSVNFGNLGFGGWSMNLRHHDRELFFKITRVEAAFNGWSSGTSRWL